MSRLSDEKVSEIIIAHLKRAGDFPVTMRKLLAGLGIGSEQRRRVRRLVRSLMQVGRVVSPSKGQYSLAGRHNKPEAKVESAARSGRPVTGVLRHKGRYTVMVPDGEGLSGPITLDQRVAGSLPEGVIVAVRVADTASRARPRGELLRVLGQPGLLSTELPRLIIEYGLDEGFPDQVESETATVDFDPDEFPRRDLRQIPLVTIDPPDAKDFDDAVFVSKQGRGFRLLVSIADVSALVAAGSALDAEALRRGCSVYLPGRVYPMLPSRLSEDLCSLAPGLDRPAMTVEMEIDQAGTVRAARFFRSLMSSAGRFSYAQVQQALDGHDRTQFSDMAACARSLITRMSERGALDLDLPESRIQLGTDGRPSEILPAERFFAHRMIEVFMVAANEAVATFFERHEIPAVYRVHPPPDTEKIGAFSKIAKSLGTPVSFGASPRAAALNAYLGSVEAKPLKSLLSQLLLRSMMQAAYSPVCEGHYGLASSAYLHFTSPIRRYPDLAVHRQLGACIDLADGDELSLDGKISATGNESGVMTEEDMQRIADACSRTERLALEADRAASDLYRAAFMQEKIEQVFEGSISHVADFGVFVRLLPHGVEGLVHISKMRDDYYRYNQDAMTLTGKRSGRTFRLGMQIKARVEAVRLFPPQVDLVFVN